MASHGPAETIDAMEKELRQTSPGIAELLELFGGCEEAAAQADAYLGLVVDTPLITTTNCTRCLASPFGYSGKGRARTR